MIKAKFLPYLNVINILLLIQLLCCSTSDVFPENLKNCQESHNMLEHTDRLQHGYGQSKWLAEQIVNSASLNGLPVIISR